MKLPYSLGQVTVRAQHDAVFAVDVASPVEEIAESIVQGIATDLIVEVGGVKNHLAAWLDPDHWADDWELPDGQDDAAEYVMGILLGALEES